MTLHDYANEVVVMLTILKLKSVVLLGHSFGGAIAMKIASQRPELVKHLIIVDSSGIRPERSLGANIWIGMVKLGNMVLELPGLEKIRQKARKALYAVGPLKGSDYAVLHEPKMKETFKNIITDDISDDATRIVCPTTLVWGSEDKDTPPWMGERFHALISQSELVVLQGAGHFSYLDHVEKFIDLVRGRVG
jgi:pimeloyl-ACP methyl ester carboxylesterase